MCSVGTDTSSMVFDTFFLYFIFKMCEGMLGVGVMIVVEDLH